MGFGGVRTSPLTPIIILRGERRGREGKEGGEVGATGQEEGRGGF